MLQAAEVLSESGGVIELRALKHGSTTAGYFSDLEDLSRKAAGLDEQGATTYITLNPVKPALLARAENKVKRSLRETTSDKDVLRRRWLLVDADPNLPSGISSTNAEKESALELGGKCTATSESRAGRSRWRGTQATVRTCCTL